MNPAAVLLDLHARGARLEARGERLHVDAPAGTLTPELRTTLTREKAALLAALAAPRRTAYAAWETALAEVADHWEVHAKEVRARGQEPRWFDDEPLTVAVRQAIKATVDVATLTATLEAIFRWRHAWLGLLAEEERSSNAGVQRTG